jgi:tetratricopeptide (TPR) repeat protein
MNEAHAGGLGLDTHGGEKAPAVGADSGPRQLDHTSRDTGIDDVPGDARLPDGASSSDGSVDGDEAGTPVMLTEEEIERRRVLMRSAKRRFRRGRYDEATALLAEAARLRDDADIHSLTANIYQRQRDYPEAAAALEKAIDRRPERAHYYDRLGTLYIKMGQTARACELFQQTLDLTPYSRLAKRHLKIYCAEANR